MNQGIKMVSRQKSEISWFVIIFLVCIFFRRIKTFRILISLPVITKITVTWDLKQFR